MKKIIIILAILLMPFMARADLVVTGKIIMTKGDNTSTIEMDDNGNVYVTGKGLKTDGNIIKVPSDITNITAAGGITVTSAIMVIQGSGGAVDITANPQIADGYDGQQVELRGNSDTNTILLETGNGLSLEEGVVFTLGLSDSIKLTYSLSEDLWVCGRRVDN